MASALSYSVNSQQQEEYPVYQSANVPTSADVSTLPGGTNTGQSVVSKIKRWLGISDDAQDYQNMLTTNNRNYERAKELDARNYEQHVRNLEYQREDSKYQRMVKDMKAAGLNPWLALQGGLSGTSAQSTPVTSTNNLSSGSSAKSQKEENTNALGALLMAVAKVISKI